MWNSAKTNDFFCTYLTFLFISNGYSCTLSFVCLDVIKYEGGMYVPCGQNFIVLSRGRFLGLPGISYPSPRIPQCRLVGSNLGWPRQFVHLLKLLKMTQNSGNYQKLNQNFHQNSSQGHISNVQVMLIFFFHFQSTGNVEGNEKSEYKKICWIHRMYFFLSILFFNQMCDS